MTNVQRIPADVVALVDAYGDCSKHTRATYNSARGALLDRIAELLAAQRLGVMHKLSVTG